MYVRYSREHGEAVSPSDISGSGTFNHTIPQNGLADLTSILKPTLINDLKFGYNSAKNRYTLQGRQSARRRFLNKPRIERI